VMVVEVEQGHQAIGKEPESQAHIKMFFVN
jgi:hypothetical protein